MPRTARNLNNATYFHIMCQGINKEPIYGHSIDIKYYIKIMYELKEEYEIEVIAYCVMNNHVHMLLNVNKVINLVKYMHRLNMKYSTFYNKKYNRVGYVFRDRYKSEEIKNDQYLNNCIKYIWDNPVKAGICYHPSEYQFSNYKETVIENLEKEGSYNFIDTEEDNNNYYKYVINQFLKDKKISPIEFKYNEIYLSEIIKILKDDLHVSLRDISRLLELNREKIRKIYLEM